MPLARLLRSPHSGPAGSTTGVSGGMPDHAAVDEPFNGLLAALFDSCFRDELDVDWDAAARAGAATTSRAATTARAATAVRAA